MKRWQADTDQARAAQRAAWRALWLYLLAEPPTHTDHNDEPAEEAA